MNLDYPHMIQNISVDEKTICITKADSSLFDLSVLKDFKSLCNLYITERRIKNLDTLKDLDLKDIRIYDSRLTDNDIRFFDRYKNLEVLLLTKNQISDISHLKTLKKLYCLHIGDNKITDFSVLKYLDLVEFDGNISLREFLSLTKKYSKMLYFNNETKNVQKIIAEILYSKKLEKLINNLPI